MRLTLSIHKNKKKKPPWRVLRQKEVSQKKGGSFKSLESAVRRLLFNYSTHILTMSKAIGIIKLWYM